MRTSPRWLAFVVLAVGTVLLTPWPASPAAADTPNVVINGRGYGHGRGMGQYGALGYALDHGWSSEQIVDHYYGGTTAGMAGNPPISVELLSWRGRGAIVTAPGLTVNGRLTGTGAALVARTAAGQFLVRTGPGCAGPWSDWSIEQGSVVLGSSTAPEIEVCENSQIRGYRGDLQVVERPSAGGSALLSRLALEAYLLGVVPRESPAGWGSLGCTGSGPAMVCRGQQALRAQAVAARSYALGGAYASYATTCDTQTCQVYGGAWTRPFDSASRTSLDDPRSDTAVTGTAGVVRRTSAGAVARTEFSSSTGGWTAGGVFPAVEDVGDAVTRNPNRTWSISMDWTTLSARLGVGTLRGLSVSRRNGLGPDGGRVLEVVADTSGGPVVLTGAAVRSRLGLRSDWFSLSTVSYGQAQSYVRGLWNDLLGRAPSAQELSDRSSEVAAGRSPADLATDLAVSAERVGHLVDDGFGGALNRSPSPSERSAWTAYFQRSRSLVDLRASLFGSPESLAASGGSYGAWVGGLYRAVLGRDPSASEQSGWAAHAAQRGRASVAGDVARSDEAVRRRLAMYYATLLQRPPDPDATGWLDPLRGIGEVTVPAGIAGSPEYRNVVQARFPS